MADRKTRERFREQLIERRKEIFRRRSDNLASWQKLNEAENEFEERAQKVNLSQGLDRLDSRVKDEIEAIDRALGKIETGDYGLCEGCETDISEKRLETLPFTPFCTECASRLERGLPLPIAEREDVETLDLPQDYIGMTDSELEEAVYDAIDRDGRVETEELNIECEEGVVYLEGKLPSDNKRQILLEIIEDVMGLPEVEDSIQIDPHLWQRRETVRKTDEDKTDEEEMMEGEDTNDNVYASEIDGDPLSPPDQMIRGREE